MPKPISVQQKTEEAIYLEGFNLAINYIYAKLEEQNPDEFTKETFKTFADTHFPGNLDTNYFENNTIDAPDEENGYERGQCPGPNGTCINCPNGLLQQP